MTDLHIPDSQLTPRQRWEHEIVEVQRERAYLAVREERAWHNLEVLDEDAAAVDRAVGRAANWNGD